ncbi:MAG: thioredoxin family protein, partial [Lactobacillus iners]|nr:thioredoxin family protein [Lactobacillus iners]
VDIDQNPDTPKALGIMAIPTILIKKDGKLVNRFTGFTPKEKLKAAIEEYID